MKDVDQSVPLAFAQAPATGEPVALSLPLLSLLCQSLRSQWVSVVQQATGAMRREICYCGGRLSSHMRQGGFLF